MKKAITLGVALAMFASVLMPVANAQTSTSTATTTSATVAEIDALLKQIKELQDQLAELTQKSRDVMSDIRENAALLRELRQGMSGDDVKALQEMLAADPDIYPEGIVSGFYGPLTAKAVMRFQQKNGLASVGLVGPQTRARLNALVDDETFACRAWGRLIAPGQAKKRVGSVEVDLSHCAKVPGGIADKLDGDWRNATSTDDEDEDEDEDEDTEAPEISDIEVSDITDESAEISWETSERTEAVLWYGTEDDLDDADSEEIDDLDDEHSVTLEDLESDTDYYFRIVATDKAGNTASSSIQNFDTD